MYLYYMQIQMANSKITLPMVKTHDPEHLTIHTKKCEYTLFSRKTRSGLYISSAVYLQNREFSNSFSDWVWKLVEPIEYFCIYSDLVKLVKNLTKIPSFDGRLYKQEKWSRIRERLLKHLDKYGLKYWEGREIWHGEFTAKLIRNIRSSGLQEIPWVRLLHGCIIEGKDAEWIILVQLIEQIYGKEVALSGLMGCMCIIWKTIQDDFDVFEKTEKAIQEEKKLAKLATISDMVLFNRLQCPGTLFKLLTTDELKYGNYEVYVEIFRELQIVN